MKVLKTITFLILSLISMTAFSQRFDQKVNIRDIKYEPQGTFAYILTGWESVTVYKWHIENSVIEDQWELGLNGKNDDIDMVFIKDDIYASNTYLVSHESKGLMKLNKETNQFEEYYKAKEGEKFDLIGIRPNGGLLLFDYKGLRTRSNFAWGNLFIHNPIKGTNTSIGLTTAGSAYSFRPSFQSIVEDQVIFLDFSKENYEKMKAKLYDISSGKSSMLMKVEFGNFVLHGLGGLFVFEYYSKKDNASRYLFYDSSGEEMVAYDWEIYRAIMFDYSNDELYLLKQDESGVDVFSSTSRKIVRSIPAFEDFFFRENGSRPFVPPAITNGKKYRFIDENIGDLRVVIGYFEKLNFETGKYSRVGKMLRDGYSFEDYEELKEMTKEMSAQAMKEKAALNASQFKSDISYIEFLPTSGNRASLEAFGKDMNGGKTWDVAIAASYDKLTTNMGKICECKDKLVVLLRAEDSENKVEGDYVVYTSETYFYLSVVNSDMKYEAIKLVGKDIHKTKTNKHTIKVEASGFLNPETSFSWNDKGDTFWVSGKSGSYTVNKKNCTVN